MEYFVISHFHVINNDKIIEMLISTTSLISFRTSWNGPMKSEKIFLQFETWKTFPLRISLFDFVVCISYQIHIFVCYTLQSPPRQQEAEMVEKKRKQGGELWRSADTLVSPNYHSHSTGESRWRCDHITLTGWPVLGVSWEVQWKVSSLFLSEHK